MSDIDPRIADYIRDNRRRYTREAIRQQLLDAGHDPGAIDATWAALEAPDADQVAGEGFWGRFWIMLIGINVGVFLLVGLVTGMLGAASSAAFLLAVLAVVLAIGALIAWGIVAATRPTQLGRTTALVIGAVIPLGVALLIGGTCYALVGAVGPPPRTGNVHLTTGPPLDLDVDLSAQCYIGGPSFSVFGQLESPAGFVTASVDNHPAGPGPGTSSTLNLSVSSQRVNSERPESYSTYVGGAPEIDADIADDGASGSVTFSDLRSDLSGPEFEGPEPEPLDGSISWTCD